MKLTFLGSGSSFVLGKENYQSNILIEKHGEKLLYDCGTTITDALDMQGHTPMDINKVFISHVHGDHSGGLEQLGFQTYFKTFPFGQKKIEVIASKDIIQKVWNHQHRGSMSAIEIEEEVTLDTYFDINEKGHHQTFTFASLAITPVSTIHSRKLESYGMYIEDYDVFISGDSKFTPDHLSEYFQSAKVIFHDCEFKEYEGSVHAQYRELKTLPSNIKKKMYLYHYMLEDKTYEELNAEVQSEGFAGLVPRGFTLEL